MILGYFIFGDSKYYFDDSILDIFIIQQLNYDEVGVLHHSPFYPSIFQCNAW